MGYLKCVNCKEEFELDKGENKNNFNKECDECGGTLRYVEVKRISRKEQRKKIKEKKQHINHENIEELCERGFHHNSIAEYKIALNFFNEALELDSEFLDALVGKGGVLSNLGDYEEALKYLDKTLEISPDFYKGILFKGITLKKMDRISDEINCYNEALEFKSDFPEVLTLKGGTLSDMGNYEDALKNLNNALKLSPDYMPAIRSKGITLVKMERYSDAKDYFNKYEELSETKEEKEEAKNLFNFLNSYSRISGYDKDKNTSSYLELGNTSIILYRKGTFTGRDKGYQEIKIQDITSIGIKKGLLLGTIEIRFAGGKIKISNVDKDRGHDFVNRTKKKFKELNNLDNNQSFTINSKSYTEKPNPLDEIKKAKELLDMGAINQKEFEKIKKRYLE